MQCLFLGNVLRAKEQLMSKERELLKRVRDTLHELKETHYDLYWDIQAALDQPEQEQFPLPGERLIEMWRDGYDAGVRLAQSKQEPVVWMYEYAVRSRFDASFTGEWKEEISRTKPDGVVKRFNPKHPHSKLETIVRNLIPLYTAPPKREPINAFKAVQEFDGNYIYKDGFIDGIKYAEKAHGIGVE